jgi:hypothetical protein
MKTFLVFFYFIAFKLPFFFLTSFFTSSNARQKISLTFAANQMTKAKDGYRAHFYNQPERWRAALKSHRNTNSELKTAT